MGTSGTWTVFIVLLLSCALLCTAGCPKKVKTTAEALKAVVTSPKLIGAERTVYDIGQAEWGPWYFSAGLYLGKPIVAYRSAAGLSLAVATTPLPQDAGDWQVMLLDPQPKARFVYLAASDDGVFISYMTGPRDDTHLMLASCLSADPVDPQVWTLEELPDELDNGSIQSIILSGGQLGLAFRDRESSRPLYIYRELASADADWQLEAIGDVLAGAFNFALVNLEGVPALGYTSKDHTNLGLLIGPAQESDAWRNTKIAGGADMYINRGTLDMAAQGKSACVVFQQGWDTTCLRSAITADATTDEPSWQLSNIVDWNILGQADILFNGNLPVVAFEAQDALWAFFATTPSPAGYRDWRMCQLCEELGEAGYNGIEAMVIDGHLLAVYIKTDTAKNITLGATLIKIPEL